MTTEQRIIAIFEREAQAFPGASRMAGHTEVRPITLATTAADIDSLAFMSAITNVENEFRVITNEEYAGLRCVGDLCRLFSGAHEEVRVV